MFHTMMATTDGQTVRMSAKKATGCWTSPRSTRIELTAPCGSSSQRQTITATIGGVAQGMSKAKRATVVIRSRFSAALSRRSATPRPSSRRMAIEVAVNQTIVLNRMWPRSPDAKSSR